MRIPTRTCLRDDSSVARAGAVYEIIDVETRDVLSRHRTRQAAIDNWLREAHRASSSGLATDRSERRNPHRRRRLARAPSAWLTNSDAPFGVRRMKVESVVLRSEFCVHVLRCLCRCACVRCRQFRAARSPSVAGCHQFLSARHSPCEYRLLRHCLCPSTAFSSESSRRPSERAQSNTVGSWSCSWAGAEGATEVASHLA